MLRRILASASIAFALSLLVATGAAATAQRTFVASTGNDAANCQLATPCRSFGAAIAKTLSGGEVVVLDSAGYGPVTITTSVSIIAPSGIYAGISVVSGNGATINAPGAIVVLRGLSISGEGGMHGILVQQADRVRIEGCVVSRMAGVGIYHTAYSGDVVVLDTIVRDNADGVAVVAALAEIMLDHVRIERSQNSGFYIAPTPGVSAAWATIVDSVFFRNGANGIWVDTVSGAHTIARIERSVMWDNPNDGFLVTSGAGTASVTLSRNAIGGSGNAAIEVFAPTGTVSAKLSENVVSDNRIFVTGAGADVWASGNTGVIIGCGPGGSVKSFGNNAMTAGGLCVTKYGQT